MMAVFKNCELGPKASATPDTGQAWEANAGALKPPKVQRQGRGVPSSGASNGDESEAMVDHQPSELLQTLARNATKLGNRASALTPEIEQAADGASRNELLTTLRDLAAVCMPIVERLEASQVKA